MLYSQLKFVQSFAYLWLYIQLSIQKGYESHGRERDIYFGHFVNKWQYFSRAFDRGCKKVFKIILYHYNMQKLFIFPISLLFHPNNEDRQDLNIEHRKLNENNRNGKQKHCKGLNLTITSNTSMMTVLVGKAIKIVIYVELKWLFC